MASCGTLVQGCIHLQSPASALSESFSPAFIISLPRLCNSVLWRRKGAPKFKFSLFYESLFPSSVFRKLKLITKTQPITLFHNTGVTPLCVKSFWNENLQVELCWWLLPSSLFTVRYICRPFFFLYKLISFSSFYSPFLTF